MKDKRDILLVELHQESRPSADALLNALHQGGWAIVPQGPLVNDESTIMVNASGGRVTVAQREDSDAIWGPPVAVAL